MLNQGEYGDIKRGTWLGCERVKQDRHICSGDIDENNNHLLISSVGQIKVMFRKKNPQMS